MFEKFKIYIIIINVYWGIEVGHVKIQVIESSFLIVYGKYLSHLKTCFWK